MMVRIIGVLSLMLWSVCAFGQTITFPNKPGIGPQICISDDEIGQYCVPGTNDHPLSVPENPLSNASLSQTPLLFRQYAVLLRIEEKLKQIDRDISGKEGLSGKMQGVSDAVTTTNTMLTNRVEKFTTDVNATIQSNFDKLPATILADDKITNLRKSIMEDVSKLIEQRLGPNPAPVPMKMQIESNSTVNRTKAAAKEKTEQKQ